MTRRRTALLLAPLALSFICMGSRAALAQKKPEPVDCVIYMQYQPDLGSEKTAYNKDIKASAEALAGKTGGLISEVNKKNTFDGVFLGIVKEGKCCKRIEIVGHGNPDGSLQLPYENPGANKLDDTDKKNAGATTVGGPKANAGDGAKWLTHFVATIKGQKGNKKLPKDDPEYQDIPSVLCPEPETPDDKGDNKPTVTLNTCWSGKADVGVAEQVAKQGVGTAGWTGSCKFPIEEKTGKGAPPQAGTGAEDSGSTLEKFDAPKRKTAGGGTKTGEKKKQPKRSVRYSERISTGQPFNETVLTGTDGETWCSYGDGIAFQTALIATDESGTEIETTEETAANTETETGTETEADGSEAGSTSESVEGKTHGSAIVSEATPAVAEIVPDQPPVTEKPPEEPATPEMPKTAEKPPEEPTTPETPPTTEKPPEEPVSEIPDTIFVKAKEEVLEGKPTGSPKENQVVKLFPPEEPALPGTDETTKETEDTGFDKDPVECTTGADGNCAMNVPPEDHALYDLPGSGESSEHYYRVDYDLPKDSGGVAETTGKSGEPDVKNGTPAGANVAYEVFSIGERTFTRLVYEQAYGLDHNFDEQFKPVFGERYEEDYCRDKQPGPPLGMQPPTYSALNRDLPEAAIRFDTSLTNQGVAP